MPCPMSPRRDTPLPHRNLTAKLFHRRELQTLRQRGPYFFSGAGGAATPFTASLSVS